ncbi:MAG: hypothetical protein ACOH5I_21975 [Oligoflexus sp.]
MSGVCKYLRKKTQTVQQMGSSHIMVEAECGLKMQSQQKQLEIYGELFRIGREGSFPTDVCPFADVGDYSKCLYFA